MPGDRRAAASAGAIAAAAGLGAAELVAGLSSGAPSLLHAIGDAVIDAAPPALKDAAVATVGTADKPLLVIGVTLAVLALGAAIGVLGRRRRPLAVIAAAALGVVGLAAALADPLATTAGALAAAVVGTAVGIAALLWLLAKWEGGWVARGSAAYAGERAAERRDFLRAASATGAMALTGGGAGRWLSAGAERSQAQRVAIDLPAPLDPLPSPPAGLRVPGLTPLYVPNGRFYRIDTAIAVPRVDLDTWRLRVGGPLAKRELEYRYDDLLRISTVEWDVTIACVSNEVGGDLVGNARWLGVPLNGLVIGALVDELPPPGTQIVGRSVDGFTAAFPIEALADRAALVAIGMNGEPLPPKHGFPARLVVAGLYGYVSATKWLSSIELHGPDFEGYWIPRGWAKEAPVKTASRIDVPRRGARVAAGTVAVAGVAWAPERGVQRVEVRADGGDWHEADLSESIGPSAWRQWRWRWEATPGRHRLEVRATDGLGRTQTERHAPPRPDGATGWHTIDVRVD